MSQNPLTMNKKVLILQKKKKAKFQTKAQKSSKVPFCLGDLGDLYGRAGD